MTSSKIIELQAELDRLTKLVYYDELTGLLNRRGFFEEVGRMFRFVASETVGNERRNGLPFLLSVLFVDLDDFKKLNDTHGHAAGDDALKMVSAVLRKHVRTGDVVGRVGGEEFVVALVNSDSGRAAAIAEKLRAQIEVQGLTASFGVAQYRADQSLDDLIDRADKAMYQAKQSGKNRVAIAD